MGKFMLDQNRTPILVEDIIQWGRFLEQDRRVDLTIINGASISTVFLGLDHGYGDHIHPVLYETMVFSRNEDEPCWRYTSEEEARIGHLKVVAMLENPND